MDRLLTRSRLIGCGLGLILAASGCRSPRPEVPPGRDYRNDGRQLPPVGFSSDAPPAAIAAGSPDATMGAMPGSNPFGSTSAGMSRYGAPTDHDYGPPTTTPMPGSPSSLGAEGMPADPMNGTSVGGYPDNPAMSAAGMTTSAMPSNTMPSNTMPAADPMPSLTPNGDASSAAPQRGVMGTLGAPPSSQ